jgi:hypothetical protein
MTIVGNNVKLDVFEGPLDLLLYLIKKNDLNIHDIPLSQITNDFLQYLGLLKDLNLNIAGEFLVMAATLIQGGWATRDQWEKDTLPQLLRTTKGATGWYMRQVLQVKRIAP